MLSRLSPKLTSRSGFAMIFGYMFEFNYAVAKIKELCKAGLKFTSLTSKANGYELLNFVCHRNDKLMERNLCIIELIDSI